MRGRKSRRLTIGRRERRKRRSRERRKTREEVMG